MKYTLYTLLAALGAAPAFAAPIDPAEWTAIEGNHPPDGCFTFEDGTLLATSNSSGKELFYVVEEGTRPMVNGSGMSVTLHFDTKAYQEAQEAAFHILFHNGNSTIEGGGKDLFHYIQVFNYQGQLNIYDQPYLLDKYHDLDPAAQLTTTLKVNYTIRNNHLCYSYELNGVRSGEYVYSDLETDPTLDWRPSFGISHADEVVFTVTDVTFTAPVPEPATATLSLLALAGLAARRRRR